jgi:hypothetical protein
MAAEIVDFDRWLKNNAKAVPNFRLFGRNWTIKLLTSSQIGAGEATAVMDAVDKVRREQERLMEVTPSTAPAVVKSIVDAFLECVDAAVIDAEVFREKFEAAGGLPLPALGRLVEQINTESFQGNVPLG